ncbi:MAG: biopolymer transporter ExbD [Rikenellaceae bacterium]|jgi:biopolymer transport protein ExbD|nr:biopolymer transporter ExbD [Rikenellaceae bacterium]
MASKKTPEVSAGSMADIAFLLLIFFLVATTMNVDSGIQRVLPAMPLESDPPIDIPKRNILLVYVSKFDNIMVSGERMDISQLKDKAKDFILNVSDDENLPQKELTAIADLPGGEYPVSKGVISLQNDRGTSYDLYMQVQNELTRAFNEVRNEVAAERFDGRKFSDLPQEQRDAVQKAVPLKISEAEPRNVGGI